MEDRARSKPPPMWLVHHVANPLLRRVLPTRLGRRVPLALVRVRGRRTGRLYEIPIGLHEVEGGRVVFTDAPWLANFRGGADAELVHGGRTDRVHGEVVDDPARIGSWLRSLLDAGLPPNRLGLDVPAGHRLTDEEAGALRKAIVFR